MSEVNSKGMLKFIAAKPIDKSDPGFKILGHKLRWLSSGAQEDKMGRIWKVLRKTDLPPAVLQQLKDMNRADMFGRDDTIRNRELVLAYAPDEVVAISKLELKEAADRQRSLITSKAVPGGGGKHMRVEEAEMSKVSSEEFFKD